MNREDFIPYFAANAHSTKKDARRFAEAYEKTIIELLDSFQKDETLTFSGFGSFEKDVKLPSIKRNPQDGSPVNVPRKVKIKFKFARTVLAMLNMKEVDDEH